MLAEVLQADFLQMMREIAAAVSDGWPTYAVRGMFAEIGRAQFSGGRDLNGLLAAYQSGASEHVARVAVTAPLDVEKVSRLAGTLFVVVQPPAQCDTRARDHPVPVRAVAFATAAPRRGGRPVTRAML